MVFLNIKKKLLNRNALSKFFLLFAFVTYIFFILSLVFGFLNIFFFNCTYSLGQASDFYAYYQAGYNVIFGLNPYKSYAGYNVVPYSYGFMYLPFFAYTFGVFFALFPPLIAYIIWICINLFLILYACYITNRICNILKKPKWVRNIAVGMWLCFTPIYTELFFGQVNLFIGILTFFSFYEEFKKKEGCGTILWTLGSLIKMIPYLLIPSYLSSKRTRKVLFNLFISLIVIICFGLIYLPYFLYFLAMKTGIFIEENPTMYTFDFRSIFYYLSILITSNSQWYGNSILIIFLVSFLFFFGLSFIATIYSKDYFISMALFVCSSFFVTYAIFEQNFTFLLPFIIVLWIRSDLRKKWFLVFLFLAIPTPFFIFESLDYWSIEFILIFKLFKIVPTIILFIFLLIKAFKTPREDKIINSIKEIKKNILFGFKKQDLKKLPNVFVE